MKKLFMIATLLITGSQIEASKDRIDGVVDEVQRNSYSPQHQTLHQKFFDAFTPALQVNSEVYIPKNVTITVPKGYFSTVPKGYFSHKGTTVTTLITLKNGTWIKVIKPGTISVTMKDNKASLTKSIKILCAQGNCAANPLLMITKQFMMQSFKKPILDPASAKLVTLKEVTSSRAKYYEITAKNIKKAGSLIITPMPKEHKMNGSIIGENLKNGTYKVYFRIMSNKELYGGFGSQNSSSSSSSSQPGRY